MPRTAIMYIAERCNQSCIFCLEEDGSWNEFIDPSTQQVFDTLGALRGRGADHITFMGGETFFRKDLPRILGEAKRVGFTRLGVTTNGTVLSKAGFVNDLVRAGLDFIEFSVHGHTPELANAIGGTHFTFERQATALAEIDALGSLHTIINVVVCKENKDHLVDVARYLCEKYPRIPKRFKFKFASMLGLALQRAQQGNIVRYEDVDFAAVGDYLAERGVPFWFYNVPLCHLRRHAERAHELGTLASEETYFDFDHRGRSEYYDSVDQLEGRIFPASSCASCTVGPLCSGIEESYRLAAGDSGLAAREDDPLPMLAAALRDRGLDPSAAATRFEVLQKRPRPSRFVRARPEGAIRYRFDDATDPLDIEVELVREGSRSFFATRRFALTYRRWSDLDPTSRADVRALLESVAETLQAADDRGLDLDGARASIASVARDGWRAESPPDGPVQRKKRIPLPVLGPDGPP